MFHKFVYLTSNTEALRKLNDMIPIIFSNGLCLLIGFFSSILGHIKKEKNRRKKTTLIAAVNKNQPKTGWLNYLRQTHIPTSFGIYRTTCSGDNPLK